MKHFRMNLALCVWLLMGCLAYGQDYQQGWAWSGIAATTLEHQSKPAPAPAPSGDKCQACNGTGQVGDGRIFKTCLDCDGTGKVKAAAKAATKKVAEAFKVLPGLDPVGCSDGRCDLPAKSAPVRASPQAAVTSQPPQIICQGGVCYPAPVQSSSSGYSVQQVRTVRKGWIFRR